MRSSPTLPTRILPPLIFLTVLLLLVFLCQGMGFTALPPVEQRYLAAKARVVSLKDDAKKSSQRESWEKLAAEFHSIYEADPAWPNRAAALYKAAESLEELSRRSCSKADTRKAIALYETLALRHASSRLADDSLYKAARLRAAVLKDDKGALNLIDRIKRQYPAGDMIKESRELEKVLLASSQGKLIPVKSVENSKKNIGELKSEKNTKVIPHKQVYKDLPLAYKSAIRKMEELKNSNIKACWRQPWEELRNEFLRINNLAKNSLKSASHFQAGLCEQNLAFCSHLNNDIQRAIALLESFISTYPKNQNADNALLGIAKLQRLTKKHRQKAITTLDTLISKYPGGDVLAEAKRLSGIWKAEDAPELASISKTAIEQAKFNKHKGKSELQILSWDSISANTVKFSLDISHPVKYESSLARGNKNQTSLILKLKNTHAVDEIKKGVKINGSILKGVSVKEENGNLVLKLDVKAQTRFEISEFNSPPRLLVTLINEKNSATERNTNPPAISGKQNYIPAQVNNIASQLGLTVHRIFIDAGHGGRDPGTTHNNLVERSIALDIAMRLGRLLKANGLEIIYSRDKDQTLQLSKRTQLANQSHADLFVSIHVNANSSPTINGFETYYLNLASSKQAAAVATHENAGSDKRLADLQNVLADVMLNARVAESRTLAQDIQRLSLFRLKKRKYFSKDNGVKSAPFHVLLGAQMPAVLIETGYCTNEKEAKNLLTPEYRHALAEGIAEGILAYRDRLIKNRTADSSLTEKNKNAI